jgi:hypothetical protein
MINSTFHVLMFLLASHIPHPSHSIFGHYSSWEDEVQGYTHDMRKKYAKHGRPLGVPEEIRFSDVGSHLPDRLSSFRRCRFCSTATKQKRSRYQCSSCLVGLCITPCFKKFHEKVPDATWSIGITNTSSVCMCIVFMCVHEYCRSRILCV